MLRVGQMRMVGPEDCRAIVSLHRLQYLQGQYFTLQQLILSYHLICLSLSRPEYASQTCCMSASTHQPSLRKLGVCNSVRGVMQCRALDSISREKSWPTFWPLIWIDPVLGNPVRMLQPRCMMKLMRAFHKWSCAYSLPATEQQIDISAEYTLFFTTLLALVRRLPYTCARAHSRLTKPTQASNLLHTPPTPSSPFLPTPSAPYYSPNLLSHSSVPIRPPHAIPALKPFQLPNLSPLLRQLECLLARHPRCLAMRRTNSYDDAFLADRTFA